MGRPAVEPVLLLKLEFLEYHYNLSDRGVIKQAQVNMAYRFFLDLSLRSELPHHTLLTYFRERLGREQHQRLFDAIVGQARQHGLVKDRLRLKDATHLIANIAIPSAVRLLAQARQQLLAAARPFAPERVAQAEAQAASIHTTTADLSGEERLAQRVQHLQSLVAWVDDLIAGGQPTGVAEPAWLALTEAVRLAHKVLADRQPNTVDQLVSFQDTDARKGYHHGPYVGYLLDVAIDAESEIITAVNVLPASGDEVKDATTLIEQEERAHGNDVQALSIDGLGSRRGDALREWTDPHGLQLEVFVPPDTEPPVLGFTVDQLTLHATKETVTCPAGRTSQRRGHNLHDTRRRYGVCRGGGARRPLP